MEGLRFQFGCILELLSPTIPRLDFLPALVRQWFDCHRICVYQEKIEFSPILSQRRISVENSECSRLAWT